MMKAIFINGSPRKNKNTAQMLDLPLAAPDTLVGCLPPPHGET
jgi:hypothetical protein